MTKTQKELLKLMQEGNTLWMFPSGPELNGRPFWPRQKRTVTKLIDMSLIYYNGKENESQRQAGMFTLGLVHNPIFLEVKSE